VVIKRIVCDTNVLVSAFIHYGGNEWKVLDLARGGEVLLVMSWDILEEFRNVITREKFGLSSDLVADVIALIIEISEFIEPESSINIISGDPSDNKFIECAVDGKAGFIISGDKHLLNLSQYHGIRILRAKEFLEMVKEG